MVVPGLARPSGLEDEIVAETRERKESYAAEHGFDVGVILRDARQKAMDAGVPLTTRAPRRPAPEDR